MATTHTKSYLVYGENGKRLTVDELSIVTNHIPLSTGKTEKVYSDPSFTIEVEGETLKLRELLEASGKAFPPRTVFEDEAGRKYVSTEYMDSFLSSK